MLSIFLITIFYTFPSYIYKFSILFVDIFPVPYGKNPLQKTDQKLQVRLAEQRRREKVEQQTKIKTPGDSRRRCCGAVGISTTGGLGAPFFWRWGDLEIGGGPKNKHMEIMKHEANKKYTWLCCDHKFGWNSRGLTQMRVDSVILLMNQKSCQPVDRYIVYPMI